MLLIYGGSQGSRAMNLVVAEWVRRGLPDRLYAHLDDRQGASYAEFAALDGPQVRVREYLSPIADAYAAADLALVRAGAMTTAELFAWGIPADAGAAAHRRGRPPVGRTRAPSRRPARRSTCRRPS